MKKTYPQPIQSLIDYIESHPDWETELKKAPYNFKSIKRDDERGHHSHVMFVYNLFDSDFSLPEVQAARGVVLDVGDDGHVNGIVAHAFDKFFNHGDPNQHDIDWSSASVQRKYDGQLLKVSRYHGEILWFTNGAFGLHTPIDYEDDQIHSYAELVRAAEGSDLSWINRIPEGWTLMFELCSKYNRIIVKYDAPTLYFIGARDAEQNELKTEDVAHILGIPYQRPETFTALGFSDVEQLLMGMKGDVSEGVVVCDGRFHRQKMKCEDYLRIKYLLGEDGVTQDRIYEAVLADETDDLLEFDSSLQERIDLIKDELSKAEILAEKKWKFAKEMEASLPDRKAYAAWALAQPEGRLWFSFLKANSGKEWLETALKKSQTQISYSQFKEKILTPLEV